MTLLSQLDATQLGKAGGPLKPEGTASSMLCLSYLQFCDRTA